LLQKEDAPLGIGKEADSGVLQKDLYSERRDEKGALSVRGKISPRSFGGKRSGRTFFISIWWLWRRGQ